MGTWQSACWAVLGKPRASHEPGQVAAWTSSRGVDSTTSPSREGLQGMSGSASLPSLAPHPYPRWSCLAERPSLSLSRQGGSHRQPRPAFCRTPGLHSHSQRGRAPLTLG